MDSISTAIMAALVTGVAGKKAADASEKATVEAYEALKVTLREKYGVNSDLIEAVEKLEKKPTSAGRKQVLEEEVAASRAGQDREVLARVYTLLDKISARLDSEQQTQDAPLHLQRPIPPRHFVGRKVELARLLAALQPGQVVALSGPGGIGKSAMVAAAVWKLAPGDAPPAVFPDGIIYHSFYNQPRVDIALEHIARTFAEDPTPTPYDAAQRALVEQQALLVLDGAGQADDLAGILDLRGGCGVLITSRDRQESPGEQQQIGPLPLDEAATLLRVWGESYARDEKAARKICELVGRLPLAIRLAGHYLAIQKEEAASYLAWLETTPLTGLNLEQRQNESVSVLVERSLTQVSQTARQALAVVGLLALSPFDLEVVAVALTKESHYGVLSAIRRMFGQETQEEQPDISLAIDELVNYGLLHQVEKKYVVGHALIHSYAQRRLTMPAKAIRRLATYYMGLTWELNGLGAEGRATFDANRPHFMTVLAECLEWEDWEAAHGLAVAVEDYLDLQGYATERIIANEIGLIAAWQLGRSNEAAWMGNLGDTYRTMGQAKWAIEHFEKALATARRLGDWHSEGNCLGNLGLAHRDLGEMEQARQYLKESQAIFEEIQSPKAALVRDWLAELDDWEG